MSCYADAPEIIDLAQGVMDGMRADGIKTHTLQKGGNRAAEMMAGMPPHVCALLWALIRCSNASDRHFGLLHLILTNAVRQVIIDAGTRFDSTKVKVVAKGVARSALHQYLFNKGKCKKCGGTKYMKHALTGRAMICSTCDGSGSGYYTQAERWRLSGVPIKRQSYVTSCERFELYCVELLYQWRALLDEYLLAYFKSIGMC